MRKNYLYYFVKKHQISKSLFIIYFAALFLILYFGLITIFGDKGLLELNKLKDQIRNKEITKTEAFSKMKAKKHLVDSMNSNSLDLDLLDEQTRKTLGYVGENEVILYENQDKKAN